MSVLSWWRFSSFKCWCTQFLWKRKLISSSCHPLILFLSSFTSYWTTQLFTWPFCKIIHWQKLKGMTCILCIKKNRNQGKGGNCKPWCTFVMKLLPSSAAAFSLFVCPTENEKQLSFTNSTIIKNRSFFLCCSEDESGDGSLCFTYERIVLFFVELFRKTKD